MSHRIASLYQVDNNFRLFRSLFFFLITEDRWIQMKPSTVCFGSRHNSYGSFKVSTPGSLITFKLTYLYGHVTCHDPKPDVKAKWGCNWPGLSHTMGTYITDSSRVRLLPKNEYLKGGGGCLRNYYKLPWANPDSPELIFDNFTTPLHVTADQEFLVWFCEDFGDCSEQDNGLEKTCAEVYGLYA